MLGPAPTGRGWVLIDDGDVGAFGAGLVWAHHRGVAELHVLVEGAPRRGATGAGRPGPATGAGEGAGAPEVVARRAAELAAPPTVWRIDGRRLAPARPAPSTSPTGAGPGLDAYAAMLRAHGVDPVVEDGTLRGEVLGLEVARVVPGEDGPPRLVVGVGRFDRDARAEMRPGEDPGRALDEVVAVVRAWRRAGVARHPANTLAPAGWLRAVVCEHPTLVGAGRLAAAPRPLPAPDLGPAPARGVDASGAPLVVVCSTGVDVDLVPTAADCRRALDPAARLVLAVPEGDDHPVTRALGAALARPAEVRTVPRRWSALTPAG